MIQFVPYHSEVLLTFGHFSYQLFTPQFRAQTLIVKAGLILDTYCVRSYLDKLTSQCSNVRSRIPVYSLCPLMYFHILEIFTCSIGEKMLLAFLASINHFGS